MTFVMFLTVTSNISHVTSQYLDLKQILTGSHKVLYSEAISETGVYELSAEAIGNDLFCSRDVSTRTALMIGSVLHPVILWV